jgi:hypothetical protein
VIARGILGTEMTRREKVNKTKLTSVERHKRLKPDNPEQSKRFVDMAREVGVDESPEAFDAVFKKVIKPKTNEDKKATVR